MKFNLSNKPFERVLSGCFLFRDALPRVKYLFDQAYTNEKVNLEARKFVKDVVVCFASRSHLQESQIVKLMLSGGQAKHAHAFLKRSADREVAAAHKREQFDKEGNMTWDGFNTRGRKLVSLAKGDEVAVETFLLDQFITACGVATISEQIDRAKKSPIETKNKDLVVPKPMDKIDSAVHAIRKSKEMKAIAEEAERKRLLGISTEVEVLEEVYN